MLKKYFEGIVKKAADEAAKAGKLGAAESFGTGKANAAACDLKIELFCDKPKNPEFGDFAINISSLAKVAKIAPPQIAGAIIEALPGGDFEVSITGGFINFKLGPKFLQNILDEIAMRGADYGRCNLGCGKKVNIEYVSANPTGPFHIGHGRWAAVGSSLSDTLKFAGYNVFQEFYINDAGNQIEKLGLSLELRVREARGEKIEMPEDSYRGDYLIDCAKKYVEEGATQDYTEYAKTEMLRQQKELLKKFGVHFDLFFSETSLYKDGEVEVAVEKLAPYLYESEGATWFKSSEFGDVQDRVIKKADGANTYLTADIAYHYNKLQRADELINIWGADHHGYIPRIKASIKALGGDPNCLTVLLGQLVNIIQDGEAVRMGKRKTMVTLEDLLDEVGVDGVRYWMLMRSIDTTLDFDIDLAKSQSDKNPVFYVQYAHARCCSILRKAVEPRLDTVDKKELPPFLTQAEFDAAIKTPPKLNEADPSFKKLILKLEEFNEVIEAIVRLKAPYLLCKYASELASDFHYFYNYTRVLTEDKEATAIRVCTVNCTKTVMAIVLKLIGVSAPERM